MEPKYKIGDKLVFIQYTQSLKTDSKPELLQILPFEVGTIQLKKDEVQYYSIKAVSAKEDQLLTKDQALEQLKEIL